MLCVIAWLLLSVGKMANHYKGKSKEYEETDIFKKKKIKIDHEDNDKVL